MQSANAAARLTVVVCLAACFVANISALRDPQTLPGVQHLSNLAAPAWPDQFKAVLFSNTSNRLTLIDMYYDWNLGAVAHVVQNQLQQSGVTWRVDWVNGTAFLFSRDTPDCRILPMPAVVPHPQWLLNATFAGKEVVDTFVCNVWNAAAPASRYYADEGAGNPVKWLRSDTQQDLHILSFQPGISLPKLMWQAPGYCFNASTSLDPKPQPSL